MTIEPAPAHNLRAVARVNGPGELLEAIPYLLGFRPSRSLVLVGLARGRLVVVARIDLAEVVDVLPSTVASMVNGGSEDVVAAFFDDDADPAEPFEPVPWGDLGIIVADQLEQAGCRLSDMLLVAQGRWWSYLCDDEYCCSPEGIPLPAAPSPFAAAATVAGIVVQPDREALAASLAPLPGRDSLLPALASSELDAVRRTVAGTQGKPATSAKRALFAAARGSAAPGWDGLDEAELVRFGVALRSLDVRDAVWLAIEGRRLDGRELWRHLGRRLPSPFDAPPLFLYGWASWRAGDGTSAGMAAERALDSDPGLSAADLLLSTLSAGVNPHKLPRMRPDRVRRGG